MTLDEWALGPPVLVTTCPVTFDVLCSDAEASTVADAANRGCVDRVVLACDPGVQSGYVLAVRLRGGVVVPIAAWVLGQRAIAGTRGRPMRPAEGPTAGDHARLVGLVVEWCRSLGDDDTETAVPQPVIVVEDWFAGVNPNTARDVARHFYYVEAAADRHGVRYVPVHNGTWKKAWLGRGNLRSDDAVVAYAAKAHELYPQVKQWSGAKVSDLKSADAAAALGIAAWYMETEST
ncbi:MAG: hypothetical protein E6Q97_37745 [Desulfurellales bacterium]|nr:MAG: hypothetical protein E6Q97_37745 [Desulfurellales bacterium]